MGVLRNFSWQGEAVTKVKGKVVIYGGAFWKWVIILGRQIFLGSSYTVSALDLESAVLPSGPGFLSEEIKFRSQSRR